MAGKTGATCSPAASLSRRANASRPTKTPAEPPERPGKHKRSTRATQEEHKRPVRYLFPIPWLVPGSGSPLGAFARPFRILHFTFAQAWLCQAFQLSGLSFQVSSLIPGRFNAQPKLAAESLLAWRVGHFLAFRVDHFNPFFHSRTQFGFPRLFGPGRDQPVWKTATRQSGTSETTIGSIYQFERRLTSTSARSSSKVEIPRALSR